jgi:hypothetical protein
MVGDSGVEDRVGTIRALCTVVVEVKPAPTSSPLNEQEKWSSSLTRSNFNKASREILTLGLSEVRRMPNDFRSWETVPRWESAAVVCLSRFEIAFEIARRDPRRSIAGRSTARTTPFFAVDNRARPASASPMGGSRVTSRRLSSDSCRAFGVLSLAGRSHANRACSEESPFFGRAPSHRRDQR